VVVDLSDKVGMPIVYRRQDGGVQTELNTSDEALEALIALGYTLNDATEALEHVDSKLSTSERVREALKG
jgi:Holliday junction resolvasome RuvABC DNA-binding subunit